MTQIFMPNGDSAGVTLIQTGPCQVTQLKTKDHDGYSAVQMGFLNINEKRIKKSQAKKPFRHIKEFRLENNDSELKINDQINAAIFKEGDIVKISGISKGKGFQGAVKKHGFGGRQSVTHGTKHEIRNVGSVGMGGAAIRKGRKMPGRMGYDRITVKNLEIIKVDSEKNILAVKGAVPGNKGTLLEIRG